MSLFNCEKSLKRIFSNGKFFVNKYKVQVAHKMIAFIQKTASTQTRPNEAKNAIFLLTSDLDYLPLMIFAKVI